MSNNFQDSLECKICYDNFDEHEHRPLTLVCENEICGHTYCSSCVKELNRRVCPACNAQFKHTTTNWFVIGLIRNPNGTSINNAIVSKLKDEVDNLKLNAKEMQNILLKIFTENNMYCQEIKLKIDSKLVEAHNQLKSIEDSILEDLYNLKINFEKNLNENKQFEYEIQERIKLWNKQLNSGEFKSDSEKLNRIYVEIEIYLKALEEKKNIILNCARFDDICYFEEKFFKFDKKVLGELKKTIDNTNIKLIRFRLFLSSKMFFNSLYYLIYSLGYLLIGFWYLFTGLLLVLIGCFKNSKFINFNFNFNEELFKIRIKTILNIIINNSRFDSEKMYYQQLQIEYIPNESQQYSCTDSINHED